MNVYIVMSGDIFGHYEILFFGIILRQLMFLRDSFSCAVPPEDFNEKCAFVMTHKHTLDENFISLLTCHRDHRLRRVCRGFLQGYG